MDKRIFLIALIAVLMLACTKQEQQQVTDTITTPPPAAVPLAPEPTPPVPEPAVNETINETAMNETNETVLAPPAPSMIGDDTTDASGDTPLSSIFEFAKVKSFSYRRVTFEKGYPDLIDVKSTITATSDTYELTSEFSVSGTPYTESVSLDKRNLKCVSYSLSANGTAVNGTCPVMGPFGSSRASKNAQFVGNQKVLVSLGEIDYAKKYEGDNVTYWTDGSRPLPVKYAVSDGANIVSNWELTAWS